MNFSKLKSNKLVNLFDFFGIYLLSILEIVVNTLKWNIMKARKSLDKVISLFLVP